MEVAAPETYKVKTPVFEGPMELLLSLVEDRKLFINEISLATIADDYINHVRALSRFSPGDVTGFVLVAATLILIKSKSLLPGLTLTEEESGQIVDLERRLKLYQLIKEAMVPLRERYGKAPLFTRPEIRETNPVFSPDAAVTRDRLLLLARELVHAMPKKEFLPEVTVRKVISIEEMITSLTERIERGLATRFSEFAKRGEGAPTKEEKVYVIVSFLAMLELVRQGLIEAIQEHRFEDISLSRQTTAPDTEQTTT